MEFVVCGLFGSVLLAISVLSFAFWIWMLVDCLQNRSLEGTDKIVWILVIIFLHFIGALVYYIVGRNKQL